MTVWQKRKLSDLADMCLGKMLDQNKNKGEFLPYLANINVRWGSIDLDNLREMRFEEREFERYGLKCGDIVMCEGGEPGRCAIWKNQTPSMMIQKALHRISAKEGIDSFFLYYALLNKGLNGHFSGFFTGAAIKHLTGESLAKIELDIPPLPLQQKIAAILAAYDDLIENNLKRIKLLEEMAQITYEEWFVRLRFPGHETTSINPESGLPDGWRMGTMQDLFDFKNGYAFKSGTYVQDGQHKIVTIKNVQDGSFIPDTTDTIAELPSNIKAHHHLSTGDIIMSLTGNVGRVCIVYGENYLLNQRVAKVVPNNPADRLYVYTLLRSRGTLTQLENISNGAAQQNLSPVNASKMPALVPTRSVLNDFNKNIGSIIDLICLKNIENNRLREARDILLPRLMTGVIDVESYDPAQLLKEAA
jgi:type I restriction enzyme S subunit